MTAFGTKPQLDASQWVELVDQSRRMRKRSELTASLEAVNSKRQRFRNTY